MLKKLKNPLFVLRVGLTVSIITFIYIIIDCLPMLKSGLFFDTIIEIFFSMSLTLIIYYSYILFSKKINLKFLDRATIFQIAVILIGIIGIAINNEITIRTIIAIVLYVALLVNLVLITLNKKFNPKLYLIIESILLVLFLIFGIINTFDYGGHFSHICYAIVYRLAIATYINYLWLYGESKNGKE